MAYTPISRKQRVSDPQKKKAIDNLNANRKKADIDALANQSNDIESRVTIVEGEVDVLQSDVDQLQLDVAGKEDIILAGTTAQYWRGDKTWQTLPTTLPPSGAAGGDLSGTYPNPSVKIKFASGVYSGGIVTINGGDATKIDISAGSAKIQDFWTTPGSVIDYDFSWATQTAVSVTYLLTATQSYIGIDKDGVLHQYNARPSNEDRRDVIILCQLGHADNTTVKSVNDYTSIWDSPHETIRDLFWELKLINEGNTVYANGANLQINKTAGVLFGMGINRQNNDKDPNRVSVPSVTAASFRYRTQNGGTTLPVSTIDPTRYDNAGTITLVGGGSNRSTNQRVYLFPNGNLVIQYGQTVYSSLSEAIQGVQSETFTQFENVAEGAILIGIISMTHTATALNNTSQAKFITVTKFGENIGGTAGISTSTLQQAYDNSVTPEITTDSTRGAVTVKEGTGTATNKTIESTDNSGNITWQTTGQGMLLRQCTEAVRDALTSVPTGLMIYNTDKNRSEFYDPFWGWRPQSIDGSSRDWGFETLHDLNIVASNGTFQGTIIGTGTIAAFATTTETGFTLGTGTTDAVSGYGLSSNVQCITFGLNINRFESRLLIPTLATAGENFVMKTGFYDTQSAANTTDGAYFLADTQGTSAGSAASNNWQIVTVSNATRTFTTTSVAISTTAYSKFRVDVNAAGTSVAFYIDNVLVGTHTTNIPTGSARATGAGTMILKSVGTTARTVNVDYLYFGMKHTTPR